VRFTNDGGEEMIAGCEFVGKLSRRIDGRVHLSAQRFLGRAQGSDSLSKGYCAHNQDVNITICSSRAARQRAIEQSQFDSIGQAGQAPSQHIGYTHGLDHQTLQISKDRALPVGLIIDLPALHTAQEDPRYGQTLQLAVHGTHASIRCPGNRSDMEGLIRVCVQQCQYGPPRLVKEGGSNGQFIHRCSHIGNNCTQYGNISQALNHPALLFSRYLLYPIGPHESSFCLPPYCFHFTSMI